MVCVLTGRAIHTGILIAAAITGLQYSDKGFNFMIDRVVSHQDSVLANLSHLLPDLKTLYTDIHSHPELSMQETRTAGIAAERLRAAGYQVSTGIGKTGVVGLLRNGPGPTVMLRADMDALPVEEATARRPLWMRVRRARRSRIVVGP